VCLSVIDQHVALARQVKANPEPCEIFYSAEWKKKLTTFSKSLEQTAKLMREMPLWHALSATTEGEEKQKVKEWAEVVLRLELFAAEATSFQKGIKPGPRPDFVKMVCALGALELLHRFERKATLSTDGGFYRLASLYYEAAVGVADQNLERQCRTIFSDSRWSDSTLPTVEFNRDSDAFRQ
jgi:hypothetical protein